MNKFNLDSFITGFYEGCKFIVEIADLHKESINEEIPAKHKKIMSEFVESLKIGVAALDKSVLEKVASDYYKNKKIVEEIIKSKPSSKIIMPSLRDIDKLSKKKKSK